MASRLLALTSILSIISGTYAIYSAVGEAQNGLPVPRDARPYQDRFSEPLRNVSPHLQHAEPWKYPRVII